MIKRTRPYRTHRIAINGKSKLVTIVNNRSIWDLLKEYINKFSDGDIILRTTMISAIYNITKSYISYHTIDSYIYELKVVDVLKMVKPGKYRKLRNIPIKLTTSQLRKISNKSRWESWFMSIDYI